jgi:hypothetical protein
VGKTTIVDSIPRFSAAKRIVASNIFKEKMRAGMFRLSGELSAIAFAI